MFISLEHTYELLEESTTDTTIISNLTSSDKQSISNTFMGFKAMGVCISDTYNHPVFPFPIPIIDTAKADIKDIYFQFQTLYSSNELTLLPWHYLIELIGDRYVVYNTRPIDTKYPLNSKQILTISKNLSQESKEVLTNHELEEFIHIGIIGNSNRDIYTRQLYDIIRRFCILPIKRIIKMKVSLIDFILFLNIGKKFIKSKAFQDLG